MGPKIPTEPTFEVEFYGESLIMGRTGLVWSDAVAIAERYSDDSPVIFARVPVARCFGGPAMLHRILKDPPVAAVPAKPPVCTCMNPRDRPAHLHHEKGCPMRREPVTRMACTCKRGLNEHHAMDCASRTKV